MSCGFLYTTVCTMKGTHGVLTALTTPALATHSLSLKQDLGELGHETQACGVPLRQGGDCPRALLSQLWIADVASGI